MHAGAYLTLPITDPPALLEHTRQARAWLLKKEEAKAICTVQAADAGFRATLESCLQEGRWVGLPGCQS